MKGIKIMKTITDMKNDIVNLYGLDNKNTAHFFRVCEFKYSKKLIVGTYNMLIKNYNKIINEE